MKRKSLIALLVLAVVAGCGDKKPVETAATPPAPSNTGTPAPDTSMTAAQPAAPSTPDASTTTAAIAPRPAIDIPLPESLKHQGYLFYGLANTKPMDLEVVSSTQSGVTTGTQTTRLVEVQGDKAIYQIERTGGLAMLMGNMEVSVEPTGIYVKSSDVAKVGERDLEIPADLKPGAAWTSRTVSEKAGSGFDVTNKFKVVGPKKVQTKKATYPDALLITSTGSGQLAGRKVTMDTKNWYVKGIGLVKSEMRTTEPGGKASTITFQESK